MRNVYFSVSLMKSMMKRREESEEVIVCIGDVMLERVRCYPPWTVTTFLSFKTKKDVRKAACKVGVSMDRRI